MAHNFGRDPSLVQRLTRSFDFVAPQPGLPAALAKARAKDVGLIAMKTLMGARLNDMRPYERGGATFAQAAFRWVLGSGHVDALIVSMKTRDAIDEYLGASGWRGPDSADRRLLEGYLALHGASQCRYGCGDCVDACPEGVPISDVMRARMYTRDYGDGELGRDTYAALGDGAAACADCAHQACRGACPYGLDLASLGTDSHRLLARS